DKTLQQVFPKYFNNVQKSKVQHHVQRKAKYSRLMGNFKKALNYSMKDNDQKNLNELILLYIARKEKKREAKAQLVIIEDPVLNNIVKLADCHIYDADNIKDPVVCRGKGKQSTKCLKAFTEENSKAAASNMKHANINNKEKGVE
ncbi:2996_t:CDS:1, partial [Gigaspora margarita]